ncbi:SDR family NAD(P)-dependent oxidoreductase [Bacillus norwichensis]|uniref:SDR family oxidoreductase n=1 Tax=Bacillus norwichensis TaxID=2762217 RepID=A0ABR8VLV9_9BACI|nr:SDR family oxidoreductase [Bacillus norwichensis]MBD8005759.1 SDR family oxidoreductase [Bacillus norwichensis]
MRLQNKVAIITAGASGMGKAGAKLFAKEGAIVNILDINEESGQAVVKEIEASGGKAHFFRTDMTSVKDIKATIDKITNKYGQIDILWNHAGTPGPSGVDQVEEDGFDFAMDLNVKSGFFLTKYVLPFMKDHGGSIIFTSSISGLVGSYFSPVYSTAKGGVSNMVRALSMSLGEHNIRVNSVCPGFTETPMLKEFLARDEDDDMEANANKVLSRVPLGRFAYAEDVANAALFLASDESVYITGVNLPVDGGYTA